MKLIGEIKIVATNVKTGKVVDVFENNNLVVNGGRSAVASMIGDGTNLKITQIAFGTGSDNPNLNDSDLTGKFVKAISGKSYPEPGSVVFSFTLNENEANGMSIREMGLFTAENVLFARKNRDVINKTADLRFDGTWKIKF